MIRFVAKKETQSKFCIDFEKTGWWFFTDEGCKKTEVCETFKKQPMIPILVRCGEGDCSGIAMPTRPMPPCRPPKVNKDNK